MTGLANIFQGAVNAAFNPKDIKGNLTGGLTETRRLNDEDAARRSAPTPAKTPYSGSEDASLRTTPYGDDEYKNKTASQRLLG